jgi:cytochrome oxidase Cu insertion factor (SCO1/SenC/PrrC family)
MAETRKSAFRPRSSLVVALAAATLAFPACSPPSRSTAPISHQSPRNNEISEPLEDFTFTERSGKPISKADLRGKVWIASFVFTRCTGPCPQVTATMARLQSELKDEKDLRLVTFTVDPDRDVPAELRKYAEHFRADKDRWLFLTGEEKTIHRLLKEGFKVPVMRNEKSSRPSDDFDHSTRLVVVDRNGNLRGYFQGIADPAIEGSTEEFERDFKQLKEKVAQLLKEN